MADTVIDPDEVTVKVTIQLAVPIATGRSMQLVEAGVPPVVVNVTVPVGVIFVPASVSITVAVQELCPPTRTLLGLQTRVRLVVLFVTVRAKEEVELEE